MLHVTCYEILTCYGIPAACCMLRNTCCVLHVMGYLLRVTCYVHMCVSHVVLIMLQIRRQKKAGVVDEDIEGINISDQSCDQFQCHVTSFNVM